MHASDIIRVIITCLILIIAGIPLWIIFSPFYLIIKLIVTIWQPYFYRKDLEKFNIEYQEALLQGIHIDFPPSVGKLFGIGPWGKQDKI